MSGSGQVKLRVLRRNSKTASGNSITVVCLSYTRRRRHDQHASVTTSVTQTTAGWYDWSTDYADDITRLI